MTNPTPATVRAYRSSWAQFEDWCATRQAQAMPASPRTAAEYLLSRSREKALATVGRDRSAIAWRHRIEGHSDPCGSPEVASVMRRVRRESGDQKARKAPARTAEVRAMVATLDTERLINQRDRALILVGFATALRRSELAALAVDDIDALGLPYGSDPATCPVRALRAWLTASGITEGPIFRPINRHGQLGTSALSGWAVGEVVKRCAMAAGMDPARFGGHSLRCGSITTAIEAGADLPAVLAHARLRRAASITGNLRSRADSAVVELLGM